MMGKIMGFLGLQDEEELMEEIVEADGEDKLASNKKKSNNKVVSLHSQKNTRVVLQEPHSYEESQEIADHLRSRRPIIVNLQRLDQDSARRIVDFLSGCVYALNGNIKKIGPSIFLCAPENIDIQGGISENIEEENKYN